jgi:predicted nucleic acid-binding protein
MDTYLAAFAITGGMRLATLDKDFRKYEAKGLNSVGRAMALAGLNGG